MQTMSEERLFGFAAKLLCTAPAMLYPLAKKCHNPDYVIPPHIAKMLEDYKLTDKGVIPENIKESVLKHIKLDTKGENSMTLV